MSNNQNIPIQIIWKIRPRQALEKDSAQYANEVTGAKIMTKVQQEEAGQHGAWKR